MLFGACSSRAEQPEADQAPGAPSQTQSSVASSPTPSNFSESSETNEFAPLNRAEGFGFLRVMTLEERPNPLDVVIYQAIPNELPRVAGVITSVAQTPLSHVNLRAIQDNVPNAYIENALEATSITQNIGRYVKYTVTEDGYTIIPATQDEVETHHAALRPSATQTPVRDLSVTTISPLSEISFQDWTAYGVKTANLATLSRLELPGAWVPDGFGVPFSFYDDFMESNGLYEQVRVMLEDSEFRTDPEVQKDQLDAIRDAIKDSPMSDSALTALDALQGSFPAETSLRCRSSTNNEDLPNFNGAGLYDSRTQHPNEGHIAKCIRQVYASVWNLRAFLERDFYRIDHLSTAMGVLIHPNFENEQANGVAVSIDPVFETPGAYYVNTQLGEDLVTNPEALSLPEALLLGSDDSAIVITHSNLIEPGEMLMTEAQVMALRSSLAVIHNEFADLYQADSRDQFAMEIEFKITVDGTLAIKQARIWIFN